MWPRQESNLYLGLRKPSYYPLYYKAKIKCGSTKLQTMLFPIENKTIFAPTSRGGADGSSLGS